MARYAAERSRPKHPKPKKPSSLARVVAPRVAELARRLSSGHPAGAIAATRNVFVDRGAHATFDLEDSPKASSRKSTRKTANRAKPDSNLRRRAMRKDSAPKTRARKAGS